MAAITEQAATTRNLFACVEDVRRSQASEEPPFEQSATGDGTHRRSNQGDPGGAPITRSLYPMAGAQTPSDHECRCTATGVRAFVLAPKPVTPISCMIVVIDARSKDVHCLMIERRKGNRGRMKSAPGRAFLGKLTVPKMGALLGAAIGGWVFLRLNKSKTLTRAAGPQLAQGTLDRIVRLEQ